MDPANLIIADAAAQKGATDFVLWYRDALLPDGGAVVQSKEEVDKAAAYAERIINGNDGRSGLSAILRTPTTDAWYMKNLVREAGNIIRGLDKGMNDDPSSQAAKLLPPAEAPQTKDLALEVSSLVRGLDPGIARLTKSIVWNYLMEGFSKGLQRIDKDYYNECCVIQI